MKNTIFSALPSAENTPRASIPSNETDTLYQLVKRAEINPHEVEDASRHALEITVLWNRSVLHVAHLSPGQDFILGAQAPELRSPARAMAPGLATGVALMAAGAALGQNAGVALASVGALASASSLGAGVFTHQSNERARNDPSRFVFDLGLEGLSEARVVRHEADSSRFVFLPGAKGEVEIDGARRSLDDLIAQGIARPASSVAGGHEIAIVPNGRYRMEFGGFTLNARVVPAARKVAGELRHDPVLRRSIAGSALAAMALLGVMKLTTGDDARLTAEDSESRMAELRAFVARTQEMAARQEQPQEAAATNAPGGAAHRDQAGEMGRRNSPQHNQRYAIQRTSDRPQLANQLSARDRVAQTGIFRALGANGAMQPTGSVSGIVSPWGGLTESGLDDRNANGNLDGVNIGESDGFAGLDTIGTGIGGGGNTDGTIGTDGIHTLGHGSCRPGEDCRYGNTRGTLRPDPRPTHGPRVRPSHDVEVTGISPEAIRRVVLRNIGQVNRCYEQGLATNPNISGRVVVRFVVTGGGSVLASNVREDNVGVPAVSNCIASAVQRWNFPAVPESSGPVTVTYPFMLMTSDP